MNETKKVNMYSDDQCFRGIIVCWMCQETGRKEDREKQWMMLRVRLSD